MRFLVHSFMLLAVGASCVYASTFPLIGDNQVVGEVFTIEPKKGDTLPQYGETYDIGAYAMIRANPGVDEWRPDRYGTITIPGAFVIPTEIRNGIVINLPELRLYHFYDGQVATYPIGIGREGWSTPVTVGKVTEKTPNPTWVVPASILAHHKETGIPIPGLENGMVKPGVDNPLGKYRLRLDIPGYLIHGTNSPVGVGRRVTSGCIRLFPADIEKLYNTTSVGTKVTIINEPVKLGWRGRELFLEVHPMLDEHKLNEDQRKVLLVDKIEQYFNGNHVKIDWRKVNNMMKSQTGIADVIGRY